MKARLFGLLLALFVVSAPCFGAPPEPCQFVVVASSGNNVPLPGSLIAGASFQRLRLTSAKACDALNGLVPRTQLRLRNGSTGIQATISTHTRASAIPQSGQTPATAGSEDLTLELVSVGTTVEDGDWEIAAGASGPALAKVSLKVVKQPLTVTLDETQSPLLDVRYGLDAGHMDLDQRHSQRAVGGQAVVTPGRGDFEQYVENTATITPALELRRLAAELSAHQAQPDPAKELAAEDKWPNVIGQRVTESNATAQSAVKTRDKPKPPKDPGLCQRESFNCAELEEKWASCGTDAILDKKQPGQTKSEDQRLEICRNHLRVWRVKRLTWNDDVEMFEAAWWYRADRDYVRFETLGQLTFATFQSHSTPFDVEVSLVSIDNQGDATPIVVLPARLANGARVESLPLPTAKSMYVTCGADRGGNASLFPSVVPSGAGLDVATNGGTRAVNDEDLTTGNCRVRYSPRMLLAALNQPDTPEGRDLLKYFGPQMVRLTVSHGDAPDQTRDAPIDPAMDVDIYLPTLPAGKKVNGVYTISVKPLAPLPPAVVYRGQAPTTNPAVAAAPSELEFRANLRPRGPYGWQRAPLRMFVTFPVNVTGVRLPASPSDLKRSSSPTAAQVLPLQAGVLFAVEPWNYDAGRNLSPVPVRFVTGMHVFDLSHGSFAPSWVTGASVTLPILDLQKGVTEDQLGTDVAAGLFWELDFREQHVLRDGHHLLLTLGVNVLSLFGAK